MFPPSYIVKYLKSWNSSVHLSLHFPKPEWGADNQEFLLISFLLALLIYKYYKTNQIGLLLIFTSGQNVAYKGLLALQIQLQKKCDLRKVGGDPDVPL